LVTSFYENLDRETKSKCKQFGQDVSSKFIDRVLILLSYKILTHVPTRIGGLVLRCERE